MRGGEHAVAADRCRFRNWGHFPASVYVLQHSVCRQQGLRVDRPARKRGEPSAWRRQALVALLNLRLADSAEMLAEMLWDGKQEGIGWVRR